MENVTYGIIKDLKEGKLVLIDGEPCKVVEISLSKTGKHGAEKARVDAISLFTNRKKTLMKPADAQIEIPILERKNVQIVASLGDKVQVMDMQTYEVYEIECPEDLKDKIVPGAEAEVVEIMGKRILSRIKK
ncbi:MAG: translation initiation factor IF-5A [archaeon]